MKNPEVIYCVRPDGYENEHNDCTVRALSIAARIPYSTAHAAFKAAGRKDRHGIKIKGTQQDRRKLYKRVFKSLDIKTRLVKRKGSLFKFLRDNPEGRFICLCRGHAFAVVDGYAIDEERNVRLKAAWKVF